MIRLLMVIIGSTLAIWSLAKRRKRDSLSGIGTQKIPTSEPVLERADNVSQSELSA